MYYNKPVEFSLNVFTECAEFTEVSDKNHYSKRARICHPTTSCVRDQDATTAPTRHMWETRSLNWAQFMLHWFIRFPRILWIQWIPVPFRENSIRASLFCMLLDVFQMYILPWFTPKAYTSSTDGRYCFQFRFSLLSSFILFVAQCKYFIVKKTARILITMAYQSFVYEIEKIESRTSS